MDFEKTLSEERSRRVKSLSNSRALYIGSRAPLKEAGGQALIVLSYAHWEGFFNFCVDTYVAYLNSLKKRVVDLNPALWACAIEPHLSSLKDRGFRMDLRPEFARNIYATINLTEVSRGISIFKSASNLDYARLKICLDALGIDEQAFVAHQNFIIHELVKWRHQVAHGDDPVLGKADLVAHSHRTELLLLILKESFEDKLRSFT